MNRRTLEAACGGVASVLLSGLLFLLSLPGGEHGALAWFALVPLMAATRGKGFLTGFMAGLATIFWAAWLSTTGLLYANRASGSDAWVYTGFGIFGSTFAVVFALWGDRWSARLPAWWFAAAATLLEAALLIELPAHFALSQYRNAAMVQLASVGGIWIVSFLLWWANFSLAMRQNVARVLIAVSLVVLLGHAWWPAAGPKRRFAAVQVAQPEASTLRQAQAAAANAGALLAVWPEFGGLVLAPKGDTAALRAFQGPPFATSFRDAGKPLPHNVAALFANGRESTRYAKRKLFGDEIRMHAPGDRAVVWRGVGLNVCFDSCFPSIVRDTARLGAEVVALPTIDPPSHNFFIAGIHAAYSPFRAAESGVAIVRADGDAYSSIVDAQGRIVGESPPGDRVLVADAAIGPRWTPAKAMGDFWLWICGALVVWGLMPRRKTRPREARQTPRGRRDSAATPSDVR